ncbi:hypothetical protein CMEL01_10235 [Colletotrichum melonis]|uniref:alpha-L-rhamnosidase n=1 Tax=Colletotrichum melonis TaxID=1209925 RepID=A0AAI9TUL9_9PEZI|nr:hypothetical protein CMEL01_10235 [Colletotrichum melonis]
MSVSIFDLQFEQHRSALGIHQTTPRISWRFEGDAANWTQLGYDLEVTKQGITEVFHVESADSVFVPWPTVQLSEGESASVRAKAYGHNGQPETSWSKSVTVETGLLSPESWQGALTITTPDKRADRNTTQHPALFRKDFHIDSEVQSARLYITALGIYEAELNGQRVGDYVLAPGWQSYAHRHVYDTYDITSFLEAGDNAIGVTIGEGWFSGRLTWGGGINNVYGEDLGLKSLLKISFKNGTIQYIGTDETWMSTEAPTYSSSIYVGESFDSRLVQKGWSSPGFENQSVWKGVRPTLGPSHLVHADGPGIRRIEEVTLKSVTSSPKGATLLDFGQNLVGWLKIKVDGPSGTTIKLTHAEVLENGEIGTRPLRGALQTDYITLNGEGELTWEPKFTYHGFRYVQVEGWPQETSLDSNSVSAVVVHTDLARTGYFRSSNDKLNRLHENALWSMKGNFMSIPTDCPQRDERLGWTGDVTAFGPTSVFLYDTSGFWKGWMKDVNAEQADAGGIPPVLIPHVPQGWTANGYPPTAIWGDVAVIHPYNIFQAFGDRDLLREHWPGVKLWLDDGVRRDSTGLWDRSAFQFGDWLDPLAPPWDPAASQTNKFLVADAYLVHGIGLAAQMAEWLGETADADRYNTAYSNLKTKFQAAWINIDGTMVSETQTGLILPLYFGLIPDAQVANATQRLRAIIEQNQYKVGTGFAATHYLGLGLSAVNATDTFYGMIQQEEVPGWLYQVKMGGTTTWERWDSMLPDGKINPGDMTSFNHYAYGSVADWMHKTIGGISPAAPGYKRISIAPIPGGMLTNAACSLYTQYGLVSAEWWLESSNFRLQVTIPPNTVATITIPAVGSKAGRTTEVGSGTYTF